MPQSKSSVDLLLMASSYLVIISAGHNSYTDKEQRNANQRLVSDITAQGHYYKPVDGVYKGTHEQSYIVRCNSLFDLLHLQELSHKYMQECILIIDKVEGCILLNSSDDTTVMIGLDFEQVASCPTGQTDSYSIIDGDYWVVS